MKNCNECGNSAGHNSNCSKLVPTTVLVTPGSALIIGLSVIAAVLLLMAGGFYVLERLSKEWALDRAVGVVVAEYQLATAQAQANSFNVSPVPGDLQCLPPGPDFVHADMVVQR